MKPCTEFLRSRPAQRYSFLPAGLTLTESLSLPHCLGGHLLRSSGPEKFSNQDESHLHETTLAFDSKPALRARSRCRAPRQLALLRPTDRATPLGRPHAGRRGFHALRLTSSRDGSKMGGASKGILTRARGHAELLAPRPRSVRPSHVPSGTPDLSTHGSLRSQDTGTPRPKSTVHRGMG